MRPGFLTTGIEWLPDVEDFEAVEHFQVVRVVFEARYYSSNYL
jgi:hypothetical protein